MGKIEVVKAESKREMDDFIRLPYYIYENCAQYVPDLEREIRNLFNQKNPAREFSQIQPFVAYRDGVCVGRIVGIINRKANERWKTHNVRFSLIEFEDDLEVSKALIEAVSEWGQSQGMDAIHGPLGITDFDKEGMLMEDFDLMGSMNTVYNLEYYPRHMEALGFEKEVDWVQIRINIPQEIPARYARTAQYAREQIGLRVVKLNRNAKNLQDCVRKVFELFNEAYASIFGFSEISMEQADMFLDKYLSLIDLNLIPIVLNEKDEIVGVAVTMGSLSKAMRKDQGLGVNALFFDDLIPVYNEYGFQWAETGPQLEDNMRELTQWKPLKPVFVKRRRCFKKEMRK